jgi:hypothetical protein
MIGIERFGIAQFRLVEQEGEIKACALSPSFARSVASTSTKAPSRSRKQILAWADSHFHSAHRWPNLHSGAIPGSNNETWATVDRALRRGLRGLAEGSSLAQLLQRERGVRNPKALPRLTIKQILAWADAHHHRTGSWPTRQSGLIAGADEGQTWLSVERALQRGTRGLPGGSSLPRLLKMSRGKADSLDSATFVIVFEANAVGVASSACEWHRDPS